MTDIDDDPFAPKTEETRYADAPNSTNPVSSDAVNAMVIADAGDLSVTFKGDGGFGFPWIVPKYRSVEEALVDLGENPGIVSGLSQAQRWAALFERAVNMNTHFASLGGASAPAAVPAQPRSNAPAAAQAAPDGDSRQCKHGEMVYRTGSKNGRTWKAFMCPSPKGTPDQCDVEWIR